MPEIDKNHKYFETQEPNENVLRVVRRHWVVYMPSIVAPVLVYVISISFFIFIYHTFSSHEVIQALSAAVLSVFLLFITLFAYANWLVNYLNMQVITDSHVVDIDQMNLFSRKISELDLQEIQDVSATKKGIFQSFLNYGDVVIQTAGEMENFTFDMIPEPDQLARDVMLIRDQYGRDQRRYDANVVGYQVREQSANQGLNQNQQTSVLNQSSLGARQTGVQAPNPDIRQTDADDSSRPSGES